MPRVRSAAQRDAEQHDMAQDVAQIMAQVSNAVDLPGQVRRTVSSVVSGCLLLTFLLAAGMGLLIYLIVKS